MYLDHSATTWMHPEVKAAMRNVSFANYNANYYPEARAIKQQIDQAITNISQLLSIADNEFIFTSGATESNNFIIKGIAQKFPNDHFITSTVEHKSVLETFKYLETIGYDVSYVKPNRNGMITVDNLKKVIKENTKFVSLMHVNNETGVINPVEEISQFLHSKNILFHSDIVQSLGKIKVDLNWFDYATISGHKIAGPKGIGLAIIKSKIKPISLLHGSSQQNSLRAGTLPNELIIGIEKAIEILIKNQSENKINIAKNKQWLINFLDENLGDKYLINFPENTVDSILSIQIENQIGQIFLLENAEIIGASTGSSCNINEPSYVLKECGLKDQEIQQTIRFSLSPYDRIFENE